MNEYDKIFTTFKEHFNQRPKTKTEKCVKINTAINWQKCVLYFISGRFLHIVFIYIEQMLKYVMYLMFQLK